MKESKSTCRPVMEPWFYKAERLSYLKILPLIATFGTIGNLGILAVYLGDRRERRKSISIILSYVAVCDILLLFCSIWVFTIAKHFAIGVATVPYIFAVGQTCSTLTVWLDCLMTFERFLAICHPMRHRKLYDRFSITLKILFFITLLAILFELPRYWELDIEWIRHCDNYLDWRSKSTYVRDTAIYQYGKLVIAHGFFNFVAPFSWLTVLNVKIWLGIRNARKFRRTNRPNLIRLQVSHATNANLSDSCISASAASPNLESRQKSAIIRSRREASTSIMLIAYSVAFVIMQTPATFLYVLEFGASDWMASISDKTMLGVEHASNLLIILNSCTNFYIFLLFGSRFRQMVGQRFDWRSRNKPSKMIVSFAISPEISRQEISILPSPHQIDPPQFPSPLQITQHSISAPIQRLLSSPAVAEARS